MEPHDLERVRTVFERYVTEPAELDAVFRGAPISVALSIDSLTMLNLITDLENEFGVRFDPETLEQVFETIGTLSAFLAGGAGAPPG